MTRWLRRLRARIRYRRFDADLREEIDVHRAMAHEDFAAGGASADEARVRAARVLGNVTLARESARRVWIAPWLESVWQDVRYAVRSLRKSPGFTITAIATLTITTGLTTNFFALTEGLLFKPWPVPNPDRVFVVDTKRQFPHMSVEGTFLSVYRYLHDHARSADLMAIVPDQVRIGSRADQPIRWVSGSYFRVLRLPIISGRPLIDADDNDGHPTPVVVISQALWLDHFGGAPAVGGVLKMNDVAFTVVGIAGAGATDSRHDPPPRAWAPLSSQSLLTPNDSRDAEPPGVNTVAGRLADGATRSLAEAEIKALNARFPPVRVGDASVTTSVGVTSTALAGQNRARRVADTLALVSVVPVLALLLGCANVGNLQLARGVSRRREIAVRIALGASRTRVMRQLLIDGLVLCVAAGFLSLLIAYVLPRAVAGWYEPSLATASFDLTPDLAVFGVASVLAFATCLLSGLLPAMRATRVGAGPQYIGVERARLRGILLAIQTGVSVVLVLGAGLLVRGIQHATGSGLGFDAYNVAVVTIDLPQEAYDAGKRRLFAANLLDATDSAGLRPIGAAANVPYRGVYSADVRSASGGDAIRAIEHFVSPGYFDTLRIPLRSGRLFGRNADANEAVINETMARQLWPGLDPTGRSFVYGTIGPSPTTRNERRVVGVVADAHTESADRVDPGFYESARTFRNVIVRNDSTSIGRLRNLVGLLEPRATVKTTSIAPDLWQRLHASIVMTSVATCIGLLALLIATVGTFGVFSYVVGERTREIGVRMALGARARDVASLLTIRLCQPLAAGLLLGLLAAQPLGVVVQHHLFGISLHDPFAYAIVIGILSLSACAALVGPMRRALRVDPAVTLRHE